MAIYNTMEDYKKEILVEAKKALECVAKSKSKEVRNKQLLMIEFARHGEEYFQENHKVKLMVVGRASGVFEPPKGEAKETYQGKKELAVIEYRAEECFINEDQIEECFNSYYHEADHLSWIHGKRTKKGERYVDSKPFFGFSKKVYLGLTGQQDEIDWYKNICYTNLCKIISIKGGNPSEKLKRTQLKDDMLKLLEIEIDYYQPTHILVLDSATEDHSWSTKEFKDALRDYVSKQDPKIKICFSNRPEYRTQKELMEQKGIMEFMKEV